MNNLLVKYQNLTNNMQVLEVVPLLLLRIYLAPIFIIAGWTKLQNFDSTVAWFGNAEWGLGLPFPSLMVALVVVAELIGGVALILGLMTRVFSAMLAFTMVVAAYTVHLKNGWFAITPTDPSTSIASVFANFGSSSAKASIENSLEAASRLEKAKELLVNYGNYDWLTETGNFVVLNNGVEFAATYFIMLLVLVVYGAKNVSLDNIIKNKSLTYQKKRS